MKRGPAGASGFCSGSSATHALKATSYSGVNRFSRTAWSSSSPVTAACSQALRVPAL